MNMPESPSDPRATTADGRFFQAIHAGDVAGVQRAIVEGADPWGKRGAPLAHAASKGYLPLLETLLQLGAWPEPELNVALKAATAHNHWSLVLRLFQEGVQAQDKVREELKRRAPMVVLHHLQPSLKGDEYQDMVTRAFNQKDRARLIELAALKPSGVRLVQPLIQALWGNDSSWVPPMLACCDGLLTAETLGEQHQYAKLERLAAYLSPAQRAELVVAFGTRNLPETVERLRVDARAQALVNQPVSVAPHRRPRA